MSKNDITPASGSNLSLGDELEALIAGAGSEGMENVGSDEIVMPRLAVLQPTSPLSSEDGYSGGHIVDLATNHTYGRSVEILPIFFWTTRTNWSSPEPGSPIDCRSTDGVRGSKRDPQHGGGICANCPNSKWTEAPDGKGIGPHCTDFKNLIVIPFTRQPGQPLMDALSDAHPCVFSAKRTSQGATNKFLTMAKMLRIRGNEAPLFSSIYTLRSVKNENAKGIWYTPEFSRVGWIDGPEVFKYAQTMYAQMKEQQDKMVFDEKETVVGGEAPVGNADRDDL